MKLPRRPRSLAVLTLFLFLLGPALPSVRAGDPLKDAEKALKEAQKEAQKEAKKAQKEAEKAQKEAEKALKEAQKRTHDALGRLQEQQAKRQALGTWAWNPGRARTLLMRAGGIDPTSVPILDSDFLPNGSETAMSLDPSTWFHIHGDEASPFATGRGVVVAVLDGGFNLNHPIFAGRIAPGAWDALDGDPDPTDLGNGVDDDGDGFVDGGVGHGTFVSSMVLLAAPDASILPIRVRDDEGRGPNEAVWLGVLQAIVAGADVVNLSLEEAQFGGPDLQVAVDEAEAHGIPVVVAAGNDGMPVSPDLPGTLLVGSVDCADITAPFSNVALGSSRDDRFLYAPGVDLHGAFGAPWDGAVAWWSGTSFSTGLVSGAVAVWLEAYHDKCPLEIAQAITAAVDPVFDSNGGIDPRCGRLNLRKVLWP